MCDIDNGFPRFRGMRARFIIERKMGPREQDVVRELSEPVTLLPLVKDPRWWISQWRMTGRLRDSESVVGYVPERIEL